MILYGCLSVLVFVLWSALIYWYYSALFLCTHIICEFNVGIYTMYTSFYVSSLLSYFIGLVFTIYFISFFNYVNKRLSYLILQCNPHFAYKWQSLLNQPLCKPSFSIYLISSRTQTQHLVDEMPLCLWMFVQLES